MELVKIEKLLEKYFEATTTVAEEQQLEAYFSQEEVAPHLEEYKPMFQYFSISREEQYTKHVPLNTTRRSIYYRWISVAAVAVLSLGVYFGTENQKQKQAMYAYEETQKAFELIAQNLNRGAEKVTYLSEFENAKNKILINE
ncbi:hypothetical protein [Leptobacterium sp. I13]|uniref:hypothetical protein n=1 Tax=Leptobacterium meishanense TaxID=3128904 RepID=UPI0030EE75E8